MRKKADPGADARKGTTGRELLLFEAPPKPISEMTDKELEAWADEFGDRLVAAMARQGFTPGSPPGGKVRGRSAKSNKKS